MKKKTISLRKHKSMISMMLVIGMVFSILISPAAVFADDSLNSICAHGHSEPFSEIPDSNGCYHQGCASMQPYSANGGTDTANGGTYSANGETGIANGGADTAAQEPQNPSNNDMPATMDTPLEKDPATDPASDQDESGSQNESGSLDESGSHENNLLQGLPARGTPYITLIWDKDASKFYYNSLVMNQENTLIDVDLNLNTTQVATMQLCFSMNGATAAAPGEIEIRLPMSIFTDRQGESTDSYKLNLQENIPQGSTGFYYIKDTLTNELVIKNFNEIGGGETFICQIDYSFLPSDVKNGYSNKDITADFILRGGEPVHSNPLELTVHTSVAPANNLKKSAVKYEAWQPSWGANPDPDSADYYYLVWTVTMSTYGYLCTQPYEVRLTDTQTDGEIIGSSMSSSGAFILNNAMMFKPGLLYSQSINRYFLVKYEKTTILSNPTVTNEITASLFGVDNTSEDPDYVMTAEGKYTYSKLGFKYEGDGFYVSKSTSYGINNSSIGVPDKILEAKDDGTTSVKLISGQSYPYSYSLFADSRGYGLTLADGGDAGNPDHYGQKSYTTELVDDMLFLKNGRLTQKDYSISSCYIEFNEYDYKENTVSGVYEEKFSDDYDAYSAVELLYKTYDNGAWVSGGFIKRTGSYSFSYFDANDTEQKNIYSGSQIMLPGGVTELKFVHQGSRYRVNLTAHITITLYSTAHVREILESQSSVDLYNVCTLIARDSTGAIQNTSNENSVYGTADVKKAVIENDKELYGAVLQHGTNYIRLQSFSGTTYIDKYYSDYNDNGAEQSVTATIRMYEYGYYNPLIISVDEYKALGYVKEQTEGTFYDLLPVGTSVDSISVKKYDNYAIAEACDITYRTVADWQGSGRTMLIIDVKAPEGKPNYYDMQNAPYYDYNVLYSGFVLTYRLINSYFNIVDNGTGTVNLVAYRSKTGGLSSGTSAPNQSGFNYFQKLESDIQDDDNNNTVYSSCYYAFTYPTAAIYGIFKQVKAADDFSFGTETEVSSAGRYTYQLRYNNSSVAGKAVKLVMYDVLEELGSWRGTLESIDTSFAETKGIVPVIYYSTVNGLSPHTRDDHADLTDAGIWSTERPSSGITALAVDLSFKSDGSLYQISPNETIHCLVNMIAPTGDEFIKSEPADGEAAQKELAVNKVSYRLDYILGGVTTGSKGLSKETKVSLHVTHVEPPVDPPVEPPVDPPVEPPIEPQINPPPKPPVKPEPPVTPAAKVYVKKFLKTRLPQTGDAGIPPYLPVIFVLSFIGVTVFSWILIRR